MKHSLTFIGILVLTFMSCTADKLSLPSPTTGLQCSQTMITYVNHVQGILNSQCNTSGCHDNNSVQRFGDYQSMNQSRRELLYNRACVTKDMPPSGGMALEYIDTIRCWAEQGYLEN